MEKQFIIKDVNSMELIDKATGEVVLKGSYIGATPYTLNTRLDRDNKKDIN